MIFGDFCLLTKTGKGLGMRRDDMHLFLQCATPPVRDDVCFLKMSKFGKKTYYMYYFHVFVTMLCCTMCDFMYKYAKCFHV